ncbi:uncharacterized protein LOC141607755 [Silene latifolia]|uniref:uncharacterized protein LOC141607755 n=1 Tax=Silene latifolia TaxID=37657 RepID=UPI003D76C347
MVARIRSLGARKLSYAGRITLINSVLNTLYNYWATMFILRKGVIKRVEAICRNFLWDGSSEFHRVPTVSWEKVTCPKNEGGLGIKKAELWNIATVDWHDYVPPNDANWSWKNVCKVKEVLKHGYDNAVWTANIKGYTIRSGYDCLRTSYPAQSWSNIVWNSWNIPKHSIITWLIMNDGMNVKQKLYKWGCCDDDLCCLCYRETETTEHLFLACEYSCRVSTDVERRIGMQFPTLSRLINGNKKKLQWRFLTAVLNAVYYSVWM